MRVAIISDIHGNAVALDAALADLQRDPADWLVCLGDAVQGGPQPAAVVARLRELGCPVVMGNADDWLLTGEAHGGEPTTEQQHAVRSWSLAQLSDADQAFIAAFTPTVEVPLPDGQRVLCFHGSPSSFDDVLLPETPEEEVRRLLGSSAATVLCGGHTHLQQIRRVADALFVNPGSVGLAYARHQAQDAFHVDPWAEYTVVSANDGRLAVEFRRVPFDLDVYSQVILDSGIPGAAEMVARYRRG
jgi:putative phosphoesterase